MRRFLKRLTPRFSVRTLLALVVLVAVYIGAWQWTQRAMERTWPKSDRIWQIFVDRVSPPVDAVILERSAPMPCLVKLTMVTFEDGDLWLRRHYLFVLGRRTFKVPFESRSIITWDEFFRDYC